VLPSLHRQEWVPYVVLGMALWPIPLLNVLHAESTAVMALATFFIAGIGALRRFSEGQPLPHVLVAQALSLLLLLPISAVAMLWAPNCAFATGLLFFGLFPGVTLVLAVAVAFLITSLTGRRRDQVGGLVLLGLSVSLTGPLYDLGFHPQFYTYNHVFGGVLGPIYDEQLALRPGLFIFRGLTLLWAGLLFGAARWIRRGTLSIPGRLGMLVCSAAIIAVYAFPAISGINTTASHLQTRLSGHVATRHVDLYYDPASMTRGEAETIGTDLEAEYRRMADRLRVDAAEIGRVASYVYPSPAVKGRLTGARRTSVSPVWLDRPQIHLLRDRVAASASHELAHVFSRPFGLPGVRASWAVGLVEGWAVALEEPSGEPSPDDLVAVSAALDASSGLDARAAGIERLLSPWGFWTGRGAVSYATMGSFVSYLLDAYGPERLREVYARANFRAVYGRSVGELAEEWSESLRRKESVAVAARDVVRRRFTQPSLFETRCPHYVPPYRRHAQAASRAAADGDTLRAIDLWTRSVAEEPRYVRAHVDLARTYLATERVRDATALLDGLLRRFDPPHPPAAQLVLADGRARQGRGQEADSLYGAVLHSLPRHRHDPRSRVILRSLVADDPDVFRVLTSGDSAAVQARRLAGRDSASTAVRVWAAIRWMDAYDHAAAADQWQRVAEQSDDAWMDALSPASQRSLGLQLHAWHAGAALRAGKNERAARLARRAGAGYRRYGDRAAGEAMNRLADRAVDSQSAPRTEAPPRDP